MLGKLRLTTFKVQSTGGWLVYFSWDLKSGIFSKATKGSAATGNYPIALQLLPSVKEATLSVVILRDRLHQASLQLPQLEVGKFGEVFPPSFFNAEKTTAPGIFGTFEMLKNTADLDIIILFSGKKKRLNFCRFFFSRKIETSRDQKLRKKRSSHERHVPSRNSPSIFWRY